MRLVLRSIAVLLASLLVPAALGVVGGFSASRAQYAPLDDAGLVPAVGTPPTHDPDLPTAVVVVGANGGEVSDVLAPFEVLATTEAFNVYTVAPERRPLPLTGGLHLVPDLTFAELDGRLGGSGAADVVVVPAMPDARELSTEPVTEWLRRQIPNPRACAYSRNVALIRGLTKVGLVDDGLQVVRDRDLEDPPPKNFQAASNSTITSSTA